MNNYYNPYAMYQQPQNYQQTNPDERIWVQGEGAANAYIMQPNSFVRLWDSQSPVFYEKRTDQTGRPYMETYEYKLKTDVPTPNYTNELDEIRERLEALEKKQKGARNAKSDDADTTA